MAKPILLALAIVLQIAGLLLSPRFGWYLHSTDGTIVSYKSTTYKDGSAILHYASEDSELNIAYKNRFSRELEVSVNGGEPQRVAIGIDGKSIEELPGTANFTMNDIVWKDSSGIFFYRYIIAFLGTLVPVLIFIKSAGKSLSLRITSKPISLLVYLAALLSSLRIINI